MIKHIFKIIWNERRANGWLLIEYVFVFCILWFCCDYLYYMGRSWFEPLGFDIQNTYHLEIVKTGTDEKTPEERRLWTRTILERIQQHPEIESYCLSDGAIPYGNNTYYNAMKTYPDSVEATFRVRWISPEFLDVFRIPLIHGRIPGKIKQGTQEEILIYADWNNSIGTYNDKPYPPEKITSVGQREDHKDAMIVTGIVAPLKNAFYEPAEIGYFKIKEAEEFGLGNTHLVVRVKPGISPGFPQRFLEQMREQLSGENYLFTSVTSLEERRKAKMQQNNIYDDLHSIYAISAFLIINIFLGIIGTFWYRIQAREGEIGLRIALGATGRNVRRMMCTETILLLFIASLLAINICLQLRETDILSILGLPLNNYVNTTRGTGRDLLTYLLTFGLLGLISLIAVWYPTWRASTIQPAEALRNE